MQWEFLWCFPTYIHPLLFVSLSDCLQSPGAFSSHEYILLWCLSSELCSTRRFLMTRFPASVLGHLLSLLTREGKARKLTSARHISCAQWKCTHKLICVTHSFPRENCNIRNSWILRPTGPQRAELIPTASKRMQKTVFLQNNYCTL